MENTSTADFLGLDPEYRDLTHNRDWMTVPEQRLIWAVMERCVRDSLGNQLPEVEAADTWLWEEETSPPAIFSFQWCCEIIEIDPEKFRQKILKLKRAAQKNIKSNQDYEFDRAA